MYMVCVRMNERTTEAGGHKREGEKRAVGNNVCASAQALWGNGRLRRGIGP